MTLDISLERPWRAEEQTRLIGVIREQRLKALHLALQPHYWLSDAIEVLKAAGPHLEKVTLEDIASEAISYSALEEPSVPHADKHAVDLQVFHGLRSLSMDTAGLSALKFPPARVRQFFSNVSFPNLTSLRLIASTETVSHAYVVPGLQFLLEQHGSKLRSLAVRFKVNVGDREPWPENFATLCTNLRKLEWETYVTEEQLEDTPSGLEHLVLGYADEGSVEEMTRMLLEDTSSRGSFFIPGLRKLTLEEYNTLKTEHPAVGRYSSRESKSSDEALGELASALEVRDAELWVESYRIVQMKEPNFDFTTRAGLRRMFSY